MLYYDNALNKLTNLIILTNDYKEEQNDWVRDECLLCCEFFEEEAEKCEIECGHSMFHKTCIKDWLKIKPSCPLCVQKINQMP